MFLPTMELPLDPETRALLDSYGFDAELFARLRARMLAGELSTERNRLRGRVEVPAASDVRVLPPPGAKRGALHERGAAAIARRPGRLRRARRAAWPRASAASSRRGHGAARAQLSVAQARRHSPHRARARRARAGVPDVELRHARGDRATRARAEQSDEAPIEVFPQLISLRLDPSGRAVPRARTASPRRTRPVTAI